MWRRPPIKTLDYNFEPRCPKCGDNNYVSRILNELTLICGACKVKFKLIEDIRLFK